MVGAGAVFAATREPLVLLVAATVGVISPSGNEVGPFLAVEQAALTQRIDAGRRTSVFAWYNLVGSLATAVGALAAGLLAGALQAPLESYRAVVVGYAAIGIALALGFLRLSPAVEAPAATDSSIATRLGLHRSRRVVLRLSALFSLDAFGGGLVTQSLMAYWFHLRWGVEPAVLGGIFFAANILAAISALSAARLAARPRDTTVSRRPGRR